MKLYIKSAIMNPIDEDFDAKKEIAKQSAIDDTISTLSNDTNQYVRVNVAKNRNTSPELLTKLATDRSNKVKIAVAGNPNTPAEVLRNIQPNDCDVVMDYRFLGALLKNPNTPVDYRKELIDRIYISRYKCPSYSRDIEILRNLVSNKRTPKELVDSIEQQEIELLRYWRQKVPEAYNDDYSSPILVALGYAQD